MQSVSIQRESHNASACQKRPRILIVRLSAIGDVIHGIPVLCALRKALPDAFLAWVAMTKIVSHESRRVAA